MKKLVIVGTGLFAEVVCTYFRAAKEYEVVAFAADKPYVERSPELLGIPVVEFALLDSKYPAKDYEVFVAIGFRDLNRIRARFFDDAKAKGYKCASYVHSSVVFWPESRIGEN